jgi:membrane-associated phospholipid phosphatase
MCAVAADIVCKHILGRGWPDPTYLHNHLDGFHLLRGTHWDAFPWGTAAISIAIVSVIWIMTPRWRAIAVLTALLLSVAVVVSNYHWLSDVIAGAFLGASVGWSRVRLLSEKQN